MTVFFVPLPLSKRKCSKVASHYGKIADWKILSIQYPILQSPGDMAYSKKRDRTAFTSFHSRVFWVEVISRCTPGQRLFSSDQRVAREWRNYREIERGRIERHHGRKYQLDGTAFLRPSKEAHQKAVYNLNNGVISIWRIMQDGATSHTTNPNLNFLTEKF